MYNSLFIFWFIINIILLIFVIHELVLLFSVFKRKRFVSKIADLSTLPFVTIQLPVYNEKYVIRRLLNSAASLNYPSDKLEIQVLDDSTDETSDIIREFIASNRSNLTFVHIQRKDRTGYKAGALAYGMQEAKGEFIGIFDADFIIDPEFLQAAIPYFNEENVGVVQTKWLHLNENYSLLTRAQGLMLNTHFSIEQLGRNSINGFINFNGTAGVWRKSCIENAGGWHADTLTEDLDLSYRAQLKKWKFVYLFEVGSPAELPVTFESYRTQQFRWSKGAAECVRKNWKGLWNGEIPLRTKILGSFHLLNSSIYLLIIPLILFSPIIFLLVQEGKITLALEYEMSILSMTTTILLIFIFLCGNLIGQKDKFLKIVWFIPSIFIFFAMTNGIAFYMAIGVLQGYRKKMTAFVRTPKFGEQNTLVSRVKVGYDYKKEFNLKFFEFLLLIYGLFILYLGITNVNMIMIIYAAIIICGYSLAVLFPKKTFRIR